MVYKIGLEQLHYGVAFFNFQTIFKQIAENLANI